MTHPHVELVRTSVVAETVEQPALRHDVDFGMTELALIGRFGGTAQLRGQRLHAVADAEDRQARIKHFLRRLRCTRQRVDSGPPDRMMPLAPNAAISA